MLLINIHYKNSNAWFHYITESVVFALEFLWIMKHLTVTHTEIFRAYGIVCFHNYSMHKNVYIYIYVSIHSWNCTDKAQIGRLP